eukprot:TRINITY_DN2021_c0_g3_i1.p1 TRINITY_DN2021_c0_g3~~TRINITY_DN2021_c0_g3_i1.p1  ORF type:complete len:104 (+),score=11.07 TRINITY_DN2021_c0_g3_i1:893-1204(+)
MIVLLHKRQNEHMVQSKHLNHIDPNSLIQLKQGITKCIFHQSHNHKVTTRIVSSTKFFQSIFSQNHNYQIRRNLQKSGIGLSLSSFGELMSTMKSQSCQNGPD